MARSLAADLAVFSAKARREENRGDRLPERRRVGTCKVRSHNTYLFRQRTLTSNSLNQVVAWVREMDALRRALAT